MNKSLCFVLLLFTLVSACDYAPATIPITQIPSKTFLPSHTFFVSRTPTLTSTPYPTFSATSTSTPQPALTAHEWHPERVLISFDVSMRGDGGESIEVPELPFFILYADGKLFIKRLVKVGEYSAWQILVRSLDRKEICQNLNTLDQIGYLDYASSNYVFGDGPTVMGTFGSTQITVNAWKSNQGSFYELGYFLRVELTGEHTDTLLEEGVDGYNRSGWPLIVPALRNAYYFLFEYPVQDFEIYQPERLAVWMIPFSSFEPSNDENIREWTLTKPSLIEIFSKMDLSDSIYASYVVLTGDEAQGVYDFLEHTYGKEIFYEESHDGEKKYYLVLARPLLPYESPNDYPGQIPAPGSTKPNFKLACYPSDGVLPIPTPALP